MRAGVVVVVACLSLAGCGGSDVPERDVSISVRPARSLVDEPVQVTIRGLEPGGSAVLRSSWDAFGGATWRGEQRVRAAEDGAVVLREPAELRFLWDMRPVNPAGDESPFAPPAIEPSVVELTVGVGGRTVARGSFTREVGRPSVRFRELTMADHGVAGFLFTPSGRAARRPAVLCLGGSEGGVGLPIVAALLASRGYTTLALAYFGWPGRPDELREIPLEYLAAGLRLLRRQGAVDPRRVAMIGASRGGEAALLVASAYPELAPGGVIGLAPSSEVVGSPTGVGAAWTHGGEPLPPGPIAVERIGGPILIAGAGDDQQWPSDAYAHEIEQRLDDRAFGHPHERLHYPDAGHAIDLAIPLLAQGGLARYGGTAAANEAAREDLWPRILAFLE